MKTKIFLVDDEIETRDLLKGVLERKGYEISCFPDGKEAIEEITKNQQRPQLVVTDFEMPNLNGLELTKSIKLGFPGIKVIMISGNLPYENNPADVLLEKPCDLTSLLKIIEKTTS